ncbi:MAG: hypothetical protein JNL72_14050 [Flavipsychrobacter sp.]|nr:hypothetical protein [Flavipsychrobacter sp.]
MQLPSIIDTLVSFVFIIFIFSAIASATLEYFNKLRKKRGKFLQSCLSQNLKDEFINQVDFALLVYAHPLVAGLKEDRNDLPSYISADVFANALIEVVIQYKITHEAYFEQQETDELTRAELPAVERNQMLAEYIKAAESLKESSIKSMLLSFTNNADRYEDLKKNIITWYEHYMDRIGGWYKKDSSKWLWRISLGIVLLFNVDAVYLLKTLNKNSEIRSMVAKRAVAFEGANRDSVQWNVTLADIKELPVGYKFTDTDDSGWGQVWEQWKEQKKADGGWLKLILGWLAAATAISRGAPFWFDLLSKVVNLRSAGKKPEQKK